MTEHPGDTLEVAMLLRTQNIEPFLALNLEWASFNAPPDRTLFQADVCQCALERAGFTLHWTHNGWRAGKIHREEGWEYLGCAREGSKYILVLRRTE